MKENIGGGGYTNKVVGRSGQKECGDETEKAAMVGTAMVDASDSVKPVTQKPRETSSKFSFSPHTD